ncbi:type II toxin-antitoxin system VapC family toxin [Micromonospora haikouensis]|uniref:type II toxin-antitoxin system VapC family toxin n=1 Tax=Micromonospora haikouensis TaxID=686309 RepID=UPI0037BA000D
MAKQSRYQARIYVDTCIFLNVIKREAGLWPDSLKMLLAAERGDIQLVASTLLLAEVASRRGDVDPAIRDAVISQYLENLDVEWCEVDLFTVADARAICDRYEMRGADAVHLATAVRRRADYFVSRDGGFPFGEVVGARTQVVRPVILWNPTIDDMRVDAEAKDERWAHRPRATKKPQVHPQG